MVVWPGAIFFYLLFTCKQHCPNKNPPAHRVMDSNLCAKFDLRIFPGFCDTLVLTEPQQHLKLLRIMRYTCFFDHTNDVRSGIWLKLKAKHTNLKYMQDNLCHPCILSTTILSDRHVLYTRAYLRTQPVAFLPYGLCLEQEMSLASSIVTPACMRIMHITCALSNPGYIIYWI